jgi:hypothetical protein
VEGLGIRIRTTILLQAVLEEVSCPSQSQIPISDQGEDLQLPSTVPELRTSLADMEMEDLYQKQHRQLPMHTATRAHKGVAETRRPTPQQ